MDISTSFDAYMEARGSLVMVIQALRYTPADKLAQCMEIIGGHKMDETRAKKYAGFREQKLSILLDSLDKQYEQELKQLRNAHDEQVSKLLLARCTLEPDQQGLQTDSCPDTPE